MRIKIPKQTKAGIGGGLTFMDNLAVGLQEFDVDFVDLHDDHYDILFITGASLVDRDVVQKAHDQKKKIVLRVDNILEDRKNRNTGMSRLKEFAKMADVVVYQSEWARHLLYQVCGDGMVIHNGVDANIFFPRKEERDWTRLRVFYSKFSRNETKNIPEVLYFWREATIEQRERSEPEMQLVLAGRFSDDIRQINNPFEFHNGENFDYVGVIQEKDKMADVLRSVDVALLPYFADACSNMVMEAQACGIPVIYHEYGGTREIVRQGISIDYKANTPLQMIGKVMDGDHSWGLGYGQEFGLEAMCEKYYGLFKLLSETK